MASSHAPTTPRCPTELWQQRGGGGTTSDLRARDKLLSRSKHLLPSIAKAVPVPVLCSQNLSLMVFLLSPACFAAWESIQKPTAACASKKQPFSLTPQGQQKRHCPAAAGSHGAASFLARVLMCPTPQACSCESRAVTRRQGSVIQRSNWDHHLSVHSHSCSEDLTSERVTIVGCPNKICICSQSCCGRVPSRPRTSQSCHNAPASPLT